MSDLPQPPPTPPEQNKRNWGALVRSATVIKRAVLEGDRLWKQLTTWPVVSAFVLLGVGSGIGVLSMTPPLFVLAKMCFIGAAILLWLKSIHWLVVSRATRAERMILAFLIFGLSGMVLVETVRWISRNQVEVLAAKTATSLVGEIMCLRVETPSNTVHEIFHGEYPRDFIATLNVSVTNNGAVAAAATAFKLTLIVNETVYSCTELPTPDRSFLKRVTSMPGGQPRKLTWEPLKPFPLNTEITTRQTGWLRFWVGPIKNLNLDTAKLTLIAFDHRNQPHTIYHGALRQPPACGEIVEGVDRGSLRALE
jgi:hypothetical protein